MKKEKVMLMVCVALLSAAHVNYAMENSSGAQLSDQEAVVVANDNTQENPEQGGSVVKRFVNKATSILSLRSAREFVVNKKWYIAIIAGLTGTLYAMKKTCPWFNRLLAFEQEENDDNAQLDARLINPHRSF